MKFSTGDIVCVSNALSKRFAKKGVVQDTTTIRGHQTVLVCFDEDDYTMWIGSDKLKPFVSVDASDTTSGRTSDKYPAVAIVVMPEDTLEAACSEIYDQIRYVKNENELVAFVDQFINDGWDQIEITLLPISGAIPAKMKRVARVEYGERLQ